jgi:hypothetical protein
VAAEEAFAYVRASLVGMQRRQLAGKRRRRLFLPPAYRQRKGTVTNAMTRNAKVLLHNYLLSQMMSAMHMVVISRFRYSAQLVPWTDAELDQPHAKWQQVHTDSIGRPGLETASELPLCSAHGSQCRQGLPCGTHCGTHRSQTVSAQ